MTGTREQEIQNHNSAAPVKAREGAKPDSHPCGGCSACHQMTGIQASGKIKAWSGEGAERATLQSPCATNFFQRNLGNSYMQSLADRNPASGNSALGRSAPAIQRKCNCGGSCESCAGKEDETGKIQAKLAVGSPDDEYEQEADRVADQVMRMSEPGEQVGDNDNRMNIRRVSESGRVSGSSGEGIDLDYNGGAPLAPSTRHFMEPRFGVDFSNVRLHNEADAYQTAAQIQARAFTHGNHVWLGKGESESNRSLMAHELTHVVQQGKASHNRNDSICLSEQTKPLKEPQADLIKNRYEMGSRTFATDGETGTLDPLTGVETITQSCSPLYESEAICHPDKFTVYDSGSYPDAGGTQRNTDSSMMELLITLCLRHVLVARLFSS